MEALLERLKVRNFPDKKLKDGLKIHVVVRDRRQTTDMNQETVAERVNRQSRRGKVEDDTVAATTALTLATSPAPVPKETGKKLTKIRIDQPPAAKEDEEAQAQGPEKQVKIRVPPRKARLSSAPPTTAAATQEAIQALRNTTLRASPFYLNNRAKFLEQINELFAPFVKELQNAQENITCGKLKLMGKEGEKFQLLLHQKVVVDYLNLFTPYRGLLLYHGLGSGKTASSIAIAEGMKSFKRICVLTPASLKMNFFSELKRAGDPLYKKNQQWTFLATTGDPEMEATLSQKLSLPVEYIRKKKGAWVADATLPRNGDRVIAANFADLPEEDQKSVDDQLNQMIRVKYLDINYNGLNRSMMTELTENYKKNPFDHSVIIVDEAHNLVNRIVNKLSKLPKKAGTGLGSKSKDKMPISLLLYEYIMSAQNARVVLLSGTPLINTPNEIAVLFNMIRGYIKTWTFSVNVATQQKVTTETIRAMFDRENFQTLDYLEYGQNKLTITRNPYGFVNNTTGVCRPSTKKVVIRTKKPTKGGGGKPTKRRRTATPGRKTRKIWIMRDQEDADETEEGGEGFYDETRPIDDPIPHNAQFVMAPHLMYTGDNEPHKGGGGDGDGERGEWTGGNPPYYGVCLDETGNVDDVKFVAKVRDILRRHGLEIVATPKVDLYKALPDRAEPFLDAFVDTETGAMKHGDLFSRRILGLTSYFRSAQESLLPSFVPTEEGGIYHLVETDMSDYQFERYAIIRKEESDKEANAQKRQKKQGAQEGTGNGNGLYREFTSTYRIYSRACCNFAWPDPPGRPMKAAQKPAKEDAEAEVEIQTGGDTTTLYSANLMADTQEQDAIIQHNREDMEASGLYDNDDEDQTGGGDADDMYPADLDDMGEMRDDDDDLADKDQIERALEKIRRPEFLSQEQLPKYSPKFAAILENVLEPDHVGLHLIYSSFRTLEGIGILKLILEINGYQEFKLKRGADGEWDIEGSAADDGSKPRFVLYTGTETAEEKELIRNIYNGDWSNIPPKIAQKLESWDKDGKKNTMGDIIKVLMITASGAEGINLKNTRYVHIVEPYWNMVRVDQVVGRARRICSHEELPPELRTVEVFIYLSVFSEKQKTDRNYIDLMNRDVSREDESVPVTTDETLYEISLQKSHINHQILEVVKATSVDCALYNRDGKSVCYGAKLEHLDSDTFLSTPTMEQDAQMQTRTTKQVQQVRFREITTQGKKYHLHENTQELFDHETFMRAKKQPDPIQALKDMRPVGKLVKEGTRYKIVPMEDIGQKGGVVDALLARFSTLPNISTATASQMNTTNSAFHTSQANVSGNSHPCVAPHSCPGNFGR